EAQVRRVDRRVRRAVREVVAIEGDVDVPERDILVEQVADELVQSCGEVRAAAVDAHEGDRAPAVLLYHLMRDAHERATDVVLVEDNLGFWQHGSFLASRDRVKGTCGVLAAAADVTRPAPAPL